MQLEGEVYHLDLVLVGWVERALISDGFRLFRMVSILQVVNKAGVNSETHSSFAAQPILRLCSLIVVGCPL